MIDDDMLATYQAALLELLARELPPEKLLQHLRQDAAFAPLRDYVATFEADMVEVAALLVKKWGQHAEPAGSHLSHGDDQSDF